MRYAPEHKDRSRARILSSAAHLLRRDGIDGVSVSSAMKDAGLTHGSFYAHFSSKDELVAESIRHALDETISRLRDAALHAGGRSPLTAIVESYLCESHLQKPWNGCAAAFLGQQAARTDGQVKQAMAERVGILMEMLSSYTPGADDAARRASAQAVYAAMVGGVVIAAMYEEPETQRAILASARQGIAAMTAAWPLS